MIINLTGTEGCTIYQNLGVVDPGKEDQIAIKELLNTRTVETVKELEYRAKQIMIAAILCSEEDVPEKALIDGDSLLMRFLEMELKDKGIKPMYAFRSKDNEEEISLIESA
ncbi:hypothetical protein A3715_15370 [Oleiphilus sp. HI0009]|nr:hypothetical protein A3715_15370 [Oleiphilus sp. HI0009]